jgi:alpha-tubulin suppressor-like RCC1 family protein
MKEKSSLRPVLVQEISHIPMKAIAAGSFSASIAAETGSVYIWGTGTFGAFVVPHRMKRIKQRALQVAIGSNFGMVLTEDRRLYTWGANQCGQLGTGDFADQPGPTLMPVIASDGRALLKIAAGFSHALCVGGTTGLSIMDEQRMALEAKISELEQEKLKKEQLLVEKKDIKRRTRREMFQEALKEGGELQVSAERSVRKSKSAKRRASTLTVAKSQSSIPKKPLQETAEQQRRKSAENAHG